MMIDLDLYREVFDKYAFDIHEACDTGKFGKLKLFFEEINKKFPICDDTIKYTISTNHTICCKVYKNMDYEKRIGMKIDAHEISNDTFNEILRLLALERKYY